MSGTYWHGGPAITGDRLLPGLITGRARAGEPDGWVYVTPARSLALTYAVTADGWLFEVEPIGTPEQDPGSILDPGQSLRCREARIVRRFRPSRLERAQVLDAMARADELLR